MNYIDLFCGIGGFHQGIENVMNRRYADESVKCIFAADNNKKVAELYKKTYGINAYYDLSKELYSGFRFSFSSKLFPGTFCWKTLTD